MAVAESVQPAWLALHVAAMVTPTFRYDSQLTSGAHFWKADGLYFTTRAIPPTPLDLLLWRAEWRRHKVQEIGRERGLGEEVVDAALAVFADDQELFARRARRELPGQ